MKDILYSPMQRYLLMFGISIILAKFPNGVFWSLVVKVLSRHYILRQAHIAIFTPDVNLIFFAFYEVFFVSIYDFSGEGRRLVKKEWVDIAHFWNLSSSIDILQWIKFGWNQILDIWRVILALTYVNISPRVWTKLNII